VNRYLPGKGGHKEGDENKHYFNTGRRGGKSTPVSKQLGATTARRTNLPQLSVLVCNCSL